MSIRLIAFDLDGTLTQHKTPLSREHREILFRLREKYRLLMVGAGQCRRIFAQMERFPIDVIFPATAASANAASRISVRSTDSRASPGRAWSITPPAASPSR